MVSWSADPTVKPAWGAEIDPTHSHARGLAAAWILNEGDGPPRELITGTACTPMGAGGQWKPGRDGPARDYGGATTQGDNTGIYTRPDGTSFSDITVVAWFVAAGSPVANGRIIDKDYSSGFWLGRNGTTPNSWGGMIGPDDVTYPYRFITLSDGDWHQIAGVRSGHSFTIFGDGGRVASTPGIINGSTLNRNIPIRIGQSDQNTTESHRGLIGIVLIYDRALTVQELHELYIDPYGFLTDSRANPMRAGSGAIPTAVGMSGSLAWDVKQPVTIGDSGLWDIRAVAGLAAGSTWDALATVGIGAAASWDVATSAAVVGISSAAIWDIYQNVSIIGDLTWDNRISVSREVSAIWDMRQTAGLANGLAWDVRTPSRIAANAAWGVRRTVGVQKGDTWDCRVPAGLQRSAAWDLRNRVGIVGRSASWDLLSLLATWPIGMVGIATWDDHRSIRLDAWAGWRDCVPVNLTRTILFNIHINKGITSNIVFDTRARVGAPAGATWGLRAGIGLTGATSWTMRARVGRSGAGTWDRRARVGISNGSAWNVRTLIGTSLAGMWRNLARVGIAGETNWNVRSVAGSNSLTSWNILNGVYVSGSASWGLRAVAGIAADIEFTTFRATVPDPGAFDPAEAVAYLAAQHGAGTWGSIPGPGSVRIDHDYPTADAMRAARGDDGIPGVSIRIFNMNDYVEGFRTDPGDVLGRSLTGADGRWTNNIYLIPGEYIILYEEEGRFPVADYLAVVATPGREPPDMPPGDPDSLYYEMDYLLSIHHGWGAWGGAEIRGPSPVDHSYGGMDQYQLTRNGVGLAGVMLEIFPEADYLAGRRSERYRLGWSRTNAVGRWDWPVNLYPGRYVAVGWREGVAHTFTIEVT